MIRLENELSGCGWAGDPEEFRDLLTGIFRVMFPNLTDEDVLCDEHAPARFVRAVRVAANSPDLPHTLILRTLLNTRKRGDLKD